MSVLVDMYQQYLWLIGKLKDHYGLHVDADHRNIHTFYKDKIPVFKLLFGQFAGYTTDEIVVSFHIDLKAPPAIDWFMKLQELHPTIRLAEIHIEDHAGETYIGDDAQKIKDLMVQQEVLKMWLESNPDREEIEQFTASKIVGRIKERKSFDSQTEMDKAIIEFDLMKKPIDDGEVQ